MWTRRAFLTRSLGLVSTASTLPLFLQRSAFAIDNPFEYRQTAGRAGVPEDRILVVVQLGGGNDGLNTVVPFGDPAYYNARPQLAVGENQALKFKERAADGLGLHPTLAPMMELYDEGLLGILQGVGYPNPNRSHFTSMDIWHTADPQGAGTSRGWIGRYFDNTCAGAPEPNLCVSIGDTAPLATTGGKVQPIAFEDPNLFRWVGADLHEDLAASYDQIQRRGGQAAASGNGEEAPAAFLKRTALDAQIASEKIRRAAEQPPLASYPGSRLGRSLRMVGSMIRAGLGTRVYYTDMGGFDTHAGQAGNHDRLLGELAGAVRAFYYDLKQQGNEQRVLLVTFSEFGRRVKQNGSAGTDHGTAAPMFIVGPMVRPGVHGAHPSLTRLDSNGDLIHQIDFRSVYAGVIEHWMGGDSAAVLGGRFDPLPLIEGAA